MFSVSHCLCTYAEHSKSQSRAIKHIRLIVLPQIPLKKRRISNYFCLDGCWSRWSKFGPCENCTNGQGAHTRIRACIPPGINSFDFKVRSVYTLKSMPRVDFINICAQNSCLFKVNGIQQILAKFWLRNSVTKSLVKLNGTFLAKRCALATFCLAKKVWWNWPLEVPLWHKLKLVIKV